MSSVLYKTNGQTPPMLDLTVSSSAYGSMIPIGWGVCPVGANIIWSTPIKPTAFTINGITSYNYSVSFAAAAGEGPGTIVKVWGDDQVFFDQTGLFVNFQGEWDVNLIYTVGMIVHWDTHYYILYKQYYGSSPRPDNSGYWRLYNGIVGVSGQQVYATPTLYSGTDDQLVDPTIEADLGVGTTSAYRGLIYAVWKDLPLLKLNNKLPNIRMLVAFGPVATYVVDSWKANNNAPLGPELVTFGTSGGNSLKVGDVVTITGIGSRGTPTVFLDGQYTVTSASTSDFTCSTQPIWGADVGSPLVWNGGTWFPLEPLTGVTATLSTSATYTSGVDTIVTDICTRSGIDASLVDATDLVPIATTAPLDPGTLPALGLVQGSTMTFRGGDPRLSGSGTGSPVEFTYPGDGKNHPLLGAAAVYTLKPTETMMINPYSDDLPNILPGWTRTDGNTIIPFIVVGVLDGGSGPATWDGSSTSPYDTSYQSDILTIFEGQIAVQTPGNYTFTVIHMGGVIIGMKGATRVSGDMINAWDPTMTKTPSQGYPIVFAHNYYEGNYPNDIDPPILGSLTDTFVVNFPAAGKYPVELDYGCHIHKRTCCLTWDIGGGTLSALVPQPGTAGADPVASGSGYIVTNQKDARSIINELQSAFFFDLAETDFVLRFVARGMGGPAMTIPESDLGLVADDKELAETIQQVQDQPQTVTITFLDPQIDYQQNSQLKSRSSRVVTSRQQVTTDLTMVMSTAEARGIAEKTLYTSWMNRQSYDINLCKPLYSLLDPTDVINFFYRGVQYQERLTTTALGQNYALKLSGVSQLPNAYATTVSGGGSVGGTIPTLISGPTTLFLFDSPYLADTDASADRSRTGIYWFVASTDPTASGWPGGTFLQSTDGGTTYGTLGQSSVQPNYGTVVSGAVGMPRAFETWDTVNTISIVMAQGTLISSTDALVLAGANTLLIGNEIISFVNCTSAMAGSPPALTYTISRLIRGRRNTDVFAVYHTTNENAISLDVGVNHTAFPVSFIGDVDTYKGVTTGADASIVTPQSLTSQGNDLKPASPVHLTGVRDGSDNLTVGWIRRTRYGGDWLNGTDFVPLNEDVEAYSVDILHSDFLTRINTLTWSGTFNANGLPYIVYSATQQTADGITPGDPVHVCVYQLSSVVSRGFGTKGTL